MTRLGITGGIGSGKSHIARLLERNFRVPVYDCDAQAKRLTAESPAIRQALTQLVGPKVYDGQELVRQELARYVFASPSQAASVNAIIHPAVRQDFLLWSSSRPEKVVAVESAILYESGFASAVDYVLFVDCPEEIRLQRAMSRDGAPAASIQARMRLQQTDEARSCAHFIVPNDGRPDEQLLLLLEEIMKQITNEPSKN